MAGLRRYFQDASIRLERVEPLMLQHLRPAIGRLRGIQIEYTGKRAEGSVSFVVKEPRGTTRIGLAGAGRREVGVYQHLAAHVPMITPRLVAASKSGDWMILENTPPIRDPARWRVDDYVRAVEALADLHDRFWGLEEDLNAFAWLSRPLEADFEVHVTAAAQALERIVRRGTPRSLADSSSRMSLLASLIMHSENIARPLRQQPSTLLHGDYWPGNISVLQDGRQVVYDWQLTAVGPITLDIFAFVNKSEWWFGAIPIATEDLTAHYRRRILDNTGVRWNDDTWELLWDHALMWRFLQEWMDLLAASPDILLESQESQLESAWMEPLEGAIERRLTGRAQMVDIS